MKLAEVKPGEVYAWAGSEYDANRGRAVPFTAGSLTESVAGGTRRVNGTFANGRETTVSSRKLWGPWDPYAEKWAVIRRQMEDQVAAVGGLGSALEAIGIRETWAGEPTSCHQRVSGRTDYATGGPGGIEVVLDIAGAERLRAVLEAGRRGYSAEVAGAMARADAALSVLTLSPGILAYLQEHDRSALAQAESALEALDAARAVPEAPEAPAEVTASHWPGEPFAGVTVGTAHRYGCQKVGPHYRSECGPIPGGRCPASHPHSLTRCVRAAGHEGEHGWTPAEALGLIRGATS
jgi:hypothetical protein